MVTTVHGKSDRSGRKKKDSRKRKAKAKESHAQEPSVDTPLGPAPQIGEPGDTQLKGKSESDAHSGDAHSGDAHSGDAPVSVKQSNGKKAAGKKAKDTPAAGKKTDGKKTDGKKTDGKKTDGKETDGKKTDDRKATDECLSPTEDWTGWVRHLAKRRRPKPLSKLIGDRLGQAVRRPLSWGLPTNIRSTSLELIHELDRVTRGKSVDGQQVTADLEAWLATLPSQGATPELGWEALAWAHALPQLAKALSAEAWNGLLEQLLELSRQALQVPLESSQTPSETRLLEHQLLAGELPLTLATLLPELKACRLLTQPARGRLSLGICDALDGDGLPHAANLPSFRPLLACWTRCGYLDAKCYSQDARQQLRWLVRQTLRLCRADGSQLLCAPQRGAWCRPLFDAMLHLTANSNDRAAADRLLPALGRQANKGKLPDATIFSAWSEMAVLRCDWSPRSPLMAIRFDHPDMQCELDGGRQVLLAGPWNSQFVADGQSLEQNSQWEEVCWFSDQDIDYLELERSLSGSWRVQRQLLLSKQDGLLLLADALLGEQSAQLECGWRIPLGDDVSWLPDDESREGVLQGQRGGIRLLPLSLPEWHNEQTAGELSEDQRHLCWRTQGTGRSLFHPLLIDLDKRRANKPLTWRRLTVAENRRIQAPDVAAGYRVQIGKQQWLVYRSLSHVGNRTLLGQNFAQEFVMARFQRDGTSEPLIEIENE